MIKTVYGSLDIDELKNLLFGHIRTLPSFERVDSETFEAQFRSDTVKIHICERVEETCWSCKGTGKRERAYDESEVKCWVCDGTGVTHEKQGVSAWFRLNDKGGLKIEVNTEGTKPEVWKPDVEKIQAFIEGLAGKPCITVPSRIRKPKAIPITDILKNAKTLDKF